MMKTKGKSERCVYCGHPRATVKVTINAKKSLYLHAKCKAAWSKYVSVGVKP